ncbi:MULTISPECIES: hypothetical protein [Enterococcus]|uniref:Uncharacterized protein n=1 Tax=Enterococcus gilvus ATCC BAA-350 TaxID=1158614 RepID=R2VLU2_9ENTE|nr:hypothetical protein [Enterococcus gilvus]EOI58840.1 hypothetical protein UKC_00025 [Enterococcus gilvus ATCC BAA-350]EOW79283.1 hypothetical protein I592_03422 [Enterococcus gilvus ATCC BAA-350]OJG40517.1 hypothetical protein RV02_GL002018 [Enterococcus gilvus]BBM18334.1 hypothetical protein G15_1999 [Enterococcus avium]
MAGKEQEKKSESKQVNSTTKESKVKVIAKSNSGDGTTLKVKIQGIPNEIIHGEILELTKTKLQKLKLSSSSWSYEEVEKKEEDK